MSGDYSAQRLLEQIGGVAGLVYSSLPIVVFVPVSTVWGLRAAILSALSVAAAVLVWRLIRRESTQPAFSGFFGVAVCALIAYLMGESKGYFLLGIWTSLAWAVVFAASMVIRRPAVGYIWSWSSGQDRSWRDVRAAVYAYDLATLTWVLVFGSRFVVQGLLYNADRTGWLGVARIGMGWPLTAVAAVVTYLAVKYVQRTLQASADAPVDPASDEVAEPGSARR
ncbi:DUF3159 domain-containing protein [Mycobacterium sp. M1]|uniref:DUF3159 domain-containing protein n=1 Tax=Mycolicibacter acidiphilus TaxID=2835306 RepID=A0ABS5RCL8_9MYCO|nr:DUF3159 domain-containing protein [Mycolicibacter acidiphilus]MBS9532033.1 DUF3159 domain-containing protein [Mycolicibacter acidiphilus]